MRRKIKEELYQTWLFMRIIQSLKRSRLPPHSKILKVSFLFNPHYLNKHHRPWNLVLLRHSMMTPKELCSNSNNMALLVNTSLSSKGSQIASWV